MWVYVGNFLSVTVILLIAERYKKNRVLRIGSFLYVWLQLSLTAALRWGVGYDYNQYFNTFYEIRSIGSFAQLLSRREEIGFVLFNKGMSLVTDNVIVYLFVYYGFLYGLLLFYVYRYSEVKWCSLFIYIALDYFAISICFMRQSMAMVIGLFAMEMMKKRRSVPCILCIGAAALFHSSALILLPALLLSYVDFTKRKVQTGAVILAAAGYFGCDLLLEYVLVGPFEKYRGYLDSFFMIQNHVFSVYFQILLWILLIVFQKKLIGQDETDKRLIPVMCFGAFLALMTTRHYIIERMSLYITVYNIRTGAQILALFHKDRWNRNFAAACAMVIGLFAFCFLIRADRYGICPYQFNQGYFQAFLRECGIGNK